MLRAAPLQPLYDAPAASASRRRAIGLALSDAPKTGQSCAQYPELARISREQMRELYELAHFTAMRITHSKSRSDDITQTVFERLMTTRRWDQKKPIEAHVVWIVKSLVSHERSAEKSERKGLAHDGFQREVAGLREPSAEERAIDGGEEEGRRRAVERELEELAESVAGHPLASAVLRQRIEGARKAGEIAGALGVAVDEVYRANELLTRHLRAIRRKTDSSAHEAEARGPDAET